MATVTQEMENDDLIVRGGFETENPATSNIDWKGHLEVYIPYEGCSDYSTQPKCEGISGCSSLNNHCDGKMYTFQRPLSDLEDAKESARPQTGTTDAVGTPVTPQSCRQPAIEAYLPL